MLLNFNYYLYLLNKPLIESIVEVWQSVRKVIKVILIAL